MYHVYLLLACWPFKGGKRRRHIHGGTLPRVACWDISRRYLQVQQALPTPIRQPKPCHAFFKPFPAEPTTDQQRESYTQHSHVTRKILKSQITSKKSLNMFTSRNHRFGPFECLSWCISRGMATWRHSRNQPFQRLRLCIALKHPETSRNIKKHQETSTHHQKSGETAWNSNRKNMF